MSGLAENFWTTLPFGREVKLLNSDRNGIAAFEKPAGILSHPNEPGDEPKSLLNARYQMEGEVYEWSVSGSAAPRRLWLLNRLDSATSGVILAATNGELADEVRAQFKRKQVRKIYHALVFGSPRQPVELWRDMLVIEKRGGKIRTTGATGHVPAESRMSLVRVGKGEPRLALIRLEPRTGRSHQLRVQCAKRGLPIVGDQTYGDFPRNREFAKLALTKRLFLHSTATNFDYEFHGQRQSFTAEATLPVGFEKFL